MWLQRCPRAQPKATNLSFRQSRLSFSSTRSSLLNPGESAKRSWLSFRFSVTCLTSFSTAWKEVFIFKIMPHTVISNQPSPCNLVKTIICYCTSCSCSWVSAFSASSTGPDKTLFSTPSSQEEVEDTAAYSFCSICITCVSPPDYTHMHKSGTNFHWHVLSYIL